MSGRGRTATKQTPAERGSSGSRRAASSTTTKAAQPTTKRAASPSPKKTEKGSAKGGSAKGKTAGKSESGKRVRPTSSSQRSSSPSPKRRVTAAAKTHVEHTTPKYSPTMRTFKTPTSDGAAAALPTTTPAARTKFSAAIQHQAAGGETTPTNGPSRQQLPSTPPRGDRKEDKVAKGSKGRSKKDDSNIMGRGRVPNRAISGATIASPSKTKLVVQSPGASPKPSPRKARADDDDDDYEQSLSPKAREKLEEQDETYGKRAAEAWEELRNYYANITQEEGTLVFDDGDVFVPEAATSTPRTPYAPHDDEATTTMDSTAHTTNSDAPPPTPVDADAAHTTIDAITDAPIAAPGTPPVAPMAVDGDDGAAAERDDKGDEVLLAPTQDE